MKSFLGVGDKSGKRVRGLWKRGEVFYVQLRITNPITGKRRPQKIALDKSVTTLPQAIKALAEMKIKENKGELKVGVSSSFGDYMNYYISNANKSKHSMDNEKSFLLQWEQFFGSDMPLDRIREQSIREFIRRELDRKLSNHSINLKVYALRSMLKMALSENKISKLPFVGIKKMKHVSEKKELPKIEDIEKYVSTAIEKCPRSGKAFADYLKLLMYCGGRETEVLSLQWSDIDFEKKHLHFHRNTKFNKSRYVDFNSKLETHLKDMQSRKRVCKEGEIDWLFPSPRPNAQEGRITNFRSTLEKVRESVGVYLSDHYFRHYFISMAVMAGVDLLQLTKWVGHSDIKLIQKVYGHLNNKFAKEQAAKMNNL